MGTQSTSSTAGQSIKTTDATVTNIATYQTRPGKAYFVVADVVALNNDLLQAAGYRVAGTFKTVAAGTLAQVGTTTALVTHETDSAWAVTLDASGTEIRVRATGAADTTITWRADVSIIEAGLEAYNT